MFDLAALRDAVARGGRVVRVAVAETRGSTPREAGTAMLVGPDFLIGTIGGGTLEHEAMLKARRLSADRLEKQALGPDLGQCCGGAVTMLYEIYDARRIAELEAALDATDVLARPVPGGAEDLPFGVRRALAEARAAGSRPATSLIEGWMIEPVARPEREIWVWGAGHVGRALVNVLSPLPGVAITWIDTGTERFPEGIPAGVTALPAADPALLAGHAPVTAEHLILTYSHSLDLAICDALLARGFRHCGLIGSASKWARFRKRLANMGHEPARIAGIQCPIGDRTLGKHPQEIAVGVAVDVLRRTARKETPKGKTQGDGDTSIHQGPDQGLSGRRSQ